ncbi:hypothetical protein FQN54_008095 [Arachnomyces sp. PD_36]|nr:hypothetical protein FQN54_008095 [Arachnomyces sp. PD_36]
MRRKRGMGRERTLKSQLALLPSVRRLRHTPHARHSPSPRKIALASAKQLDEETGMDPPTLIDPDGEVIIVLRNTNAPFAELDRETVASIFSQAHSKASDVNSPAKDPEASEYRCTRVASKKGKKKKKLKDLATHHVHYHDDSEPTPVPTVEEPTDEPANTPVIEEPVVSSVNEDIEAPPEMAMEEPIEEPTEMFVNGIGVAVDRPAETLTDTGTVDEQSNPEHTGTSGQPVREDSNHSQGATQQYAYEGDQIETSFRVQVSAKHLTLASPVFKKMLSGSWKESVTFFQKGSVEVTAETWDIKALLIFLRVVHAQHRHIPRKLTLEMLAEIARLSDYYDCKEAMGIFSEIWIEALEEEVPTAYSRDLILWLWISWVFQLPSHFQKATSIVMSWSNGPINLGVPIPDTVLGDMNYRREKAISDIVFLLRERRKAFLNDSQGCGFECRSIMYGALSKQLRSIGLLSPRPTAPFSGLEYKLIVQRVLAFESPRWYGSSLGYSGRGSKYVHDCFSSSFATLFGDLKDSIEGLDLESYILK